MSKKFLWNQNASWIYQKVFIISRCDLLRGWNSCLHLGSTGGSVKKEFEKYISSSSPFQKPYCVLLVFCGSVSLTEHQAITLMGQKLADPNKWQYQWEFPNTKLYSILHILLRSNNTHCAQLSANDRSWLTSEDFICKGSIYQSGWGMTPVILKSNYLRSHFKQVCFPCRKNTVGQSIFSQTISSN